MDKKHTQLCAYLHGMTRLERNVNLAAVFGRFGLFMVAPVWAVGLLTLVPIVRNRTEGMLQGFALSVVGVVYFAWFLAHLTYLAIWQDGLGLVIYVVLATQLNDVLAFLTGKLFGRHRWTVLSPRCAKSPACSNSSATLSSSTTGERRCRETPDSVS